MNLADKNITLQTAWHSMGQAYATEINAMIEFGEKYGWASWKDEEPVDNREELALEVLTLLKKANKEGNHFRIQRKFLLLMRPL